MSEPQAPIAPAAEPEAPAVGPDAQRFRVEGMDCALVLSAVRRAGYTAVQ